MWPKILPGQAAAPSMRAPRGMPVTAQSEEEKTHRRVLRLDEGHRAVAQTETSRPVQGGVDFHLRSGGLQPGADAKADSDSGSGLIGP